MPTASHTGGGAEGAGRRTSPRRPARRRRGLFAVRDFRRLFVGQSVSELGSQVTVLALPLAAVRVLHAGAFALGLLSALGTVAFLLIGLPAGAWVDRRSRRRVMIGADVLRAAALASIPVAWALGALDMGQLDAVALVTGCLTVLSDVADQSYLPNLVGREHLVEANAKLTGSAQVARVAGPSVAGALVQAIGAPFAIAADAASFIFSAASVHSIVSPEPRPRHARALRLRTEIADGLRFVFQHRLLRAIAATTASSNFFGGMVSAVEILFLVRVVGLSAGEIGAVFALSGAGGLVGALSASRIARRIGGARATLVGITGNVGALLFPLAAPGARALLFAFGGLVLGFGAVVYNVNQVSFRQRLCPDELLGRMNATMRFVVWGVLPLGALVGGVVASRIGLRPTLVLGAVGQVLGCGFLFSSPLARLRDFPDAAAEIAV